MMQHTWVFQFDNELNAEEIAIVEQKSQTFLTEWKAHGTPVPGKAQVKHQRFLILEAEEGSTSGCSIDSMTRSITAIAQTVGKKLDDASQIAFLNADNKVETLDFRELKAAVESGKLQAHTVVFDNTMGQSSDLYKWEVRLEDSWMKRYLPRSVSQ